MGLSFSSDWWKICRIWAWLRLARPVEGSSKVNWLIQCAAIGNGTPVQLVGLVVHLTLARLMGKGVPFLMTVVLRGRTAARSLLSQRG